MLKSTAVEGPQYREKDQNQEQVKHAAFKGHTLCVLYLHCEQSELVRRGRGDWSQGLENIGSAACKH